MAELTQKQMLESLVASVDEIKARQATMETQLGNIDICLTGSRLTGKGIVDKIEQHTKCISEIKKKQYKIYTWAIVIALGINVLWQGIKTFITMVRG